MRFKNRSPKRTEQEERPVRELGREGLAVERADAVDDVRDARGGERGAIARGAVARDAEAAADGGALGREARELVSLLADDRVVAVVARERGEVKRAEAWRARDARDGRGGGGGGRRRRGARGRACRGFLGVLAVLREEASRKEREERAGGHHRGGGSAPARAEINTHRP
jgi:hypothetical protein